MKRCLQFIDAAQMLSKVITRSRPNTFYTILDPRNKYSQIYIPYKFKLTWQPRHITLCYIPSGQSLRYHAQRSFPFTCKHLVSHLANHMLALMYVVFHSDSTGLLLPCATKLSFLSVACTKHFPPSLPPSLTLLGPWWYVTELSSYFILSLRSPLFV